MDELCTNEEPQTWLTRQRKQTQVRLLKRIGIDRAIGFTILARTWASVAGLVTVALIARFLSPAEQGYYYTFGSLFVCHSPDGQP